jgi:hypothetical protein
MDRFLSVFASILFITITTNLFAQFDINYNAKSNSVQYKGNNTANPQVKSDMNPMKKSFWEIQLKGEIQSLREQHNSANNSRIEQLIKEHNKITGNVVSSYGEYYPGGIEFVKNPTLLYEPDAVGNTRIFYNTSRTMKGMGAAIEQRTTATKGRIWVVYAFSANSSSPDSLRILYSPNNGLSWVPFASVWLGGTDKINLDDLDIELLELNDGRRTLWVVYGLRATGGTGRWFTGGFAINLGDATGYMWSFSWPGNDAAKRYYNIRITTDNNSFYTSAPHTYMICSFDSVGVSGWRINTQKFVYCYSPFDTPPPFAYYAARWFYFNAAGPAGYQRTLWSDIAYYRNNVGPDSDSLIVSFSGVPDSTYIWYAKARVYGSPETGFGQRGNQTTDYKYAARLVSSDSAHGMATIFNQVSNGMNYMKYFRALNGDFANMTGQSTLAELYKTSSTAGVYSRRGINSFYFSYTKQNSTHDSVRLVHLNPLSGSTEISGQLNGNSLITSSISPKPLSRNFYNDSCFALFSESGPWNLWAAFGCSGAIIGINDPVIPLSYNLSQNYPNPFNPATTIKYSIQKPGLVKLRVFNVLGKEVAVIINEFKYAGSYIVDFNASGLSSGVYFYKLESGDFIDIKKMLIIK